jgi:hypothetical protein
VGNERTVVDPAWVPPWAWVARLGTEGSVMAVSEGASWSLKPCKILSLIALLAHTIALAGF